jgi:hypothetical protein
MLRFRLEELGLAHHLRRDADADSAIYKLTGMQVV